MASGQPGFASDPKWLAAGAGGLLAAAVALWSMRGLPGGTLMLWVAPTPILVAGLAAGPLAAIGASLLSVVLVWALGSGIGLVLFTALIAIPAASLAILGLRRSGISLGAPMVFLGLYPLVLLAYAALFFAEHQGGLTGVMERMLRNAIAQVAVPGTQQVLDVLLQLKAALLAFWMTTIWALNAAFAQRLATRLGLAAQAAPVWNTALLPSWFAILPAIAGGAWLVMGNDPIVFSAFLILLLPFFFQGLAGVHRRAAALNGRRFVIAGYYIAMLIFLQLMAPATVALGLYDQWAQRAPRGGTSS